VDPSDQRKIGVRLGTSYAGPTDTDLANFICDGFCDDEATLCHCSLEVDMPYKPERWVELAELAANEQDPEKLLVLAEEIIQLLEKKQTTPKDGQIDPATTSR
jgi:hypothetical protein